ncbi:MAG TPA: hypothetical protein EYP14_14050, partial [Planctomycetaceae bacterium]|nr:hypothetical protein [Planctomycetaceae bacterium]
MALATAVFFSGLCGCDHQRLVGASGSLEERLPAESPSFAPEVDTILRRKLETLKSLASDPAVVQAVQEGNRKSGPLTFKTIRELDEQWQNAPVDSPLVEPLLTNRCAQALRAFQEQHNGFAEIFVTDQAGLVVGATNKTSDYYQADEVWWQLTFADGRGKARYGGIEYDQSAQSESVSLSVPVRDLQTQQIIGVLKAVF